MAYLYHRVPFNMQGETLYPLNQLRRSHPETYRRAVSKYEGRERLMEREIPFLNCLWNDVLHFSPVHPEQVRHVFESFERPFRSNRYFRIDANDLPIDDTVVYLYKPEFERDKMNPSNWEQFNPMKMETYSSLPWETIEYLKKKLEAGDSPLLWVYVPHILYRGILNTRELEIAEI